MNHHTLDMRHTLCPLPVIHTQNRVAELTPGDTLEVLCTDPGARWDISAWCRIHGHEVSLHRSEAGRELRLSIRVGAADHETVIKKNP